jgi:uncharacterized protein (DUF2141 family)
MRHFRRFVHMAWGCDRHCERAAKGAFVAVARQIGLAAISCAPRANGALRRQLSSLRALIAMDFTVRFSRLAAAAKPASAYFGAALVAAVASLVVASPAQAAPPCLGSPSNVWVYVTVDGVRNAKGQVAATIYADNPDRFLIKNGSLYVVRTPTVAGATKFCVFLPQTGVYAIAVYHDEDNSGTINRAGVLGIPTEGFGFSNNPPTLASLPTFRSVRLAIPRANLSTTIHLKYPD